ncbi:TetR/AcrR family transcriptional regulator [Aliikangiella sp. IMCC44359]|uniref:TetR/AcrR family transcriptional regulator n=1 Tax=Aliikangiella sp. IMCC44359 TaxID=3459125 RepID=UPI00403A8279
MGRSGDKNCDILSAAINEFAEKGMVATTMEAIAKSANVSKRTLYRYYSSKESLLDAVVERLMQRIEPLQDMQYDPDRSLESQLHELASFAMQLSNDKHYLRLARIVIIESMRCEKEAKRLNHQFAQCEDNLKKWFKQANEAGALGELDVTVATALFHGAIRKLAFWDQAIMWKPPLSEKKANELITQTCQFFVKGCR